MNCCARMPRCRSPGASNIIEMWRAQRSFGDGLIAEEVSDLREDWMRDADQVLADEQMVTVNCSIPPVGWQGRPNASRRKSPRA
jgi:hypothetical protein